MPSAERRRPGPAPLAVLLLLAACQAPPQDPARRAQERIDASAPAPTPAAQAASQPPSATPSQSTAAAAAVVRDYYAAIDAGDYTRAYAVWSQDGAASGQSLQQFRDGYARTAAVAAEVGQPYAEEGAAGSRYIRVPVRIRATQRDGSVRRYQGDFILRAVMADGAGPGQRRWHLQAAELQRLPE